MPIFSTHWQTHLSQEREQKLQTSKYNFSLLLTTPPSILCILKDADEIYSIFKTIESWPPIFLLEISVFNFVKGYVNFSTVKSNWSIRAKR